MIVYAQGGLHERSARKGARVYSRRQR